MSPNAAQQHQVPRILILESPASDACGLESELKLVQLADSCRRVGTLADFQAALTEFEPDVVVAADLPPQCTAVDALQALRARRGSTPFIVVTNPAMDCVALESAREGTADVILENNRSRLPELIRNAVALQESRKALQAAQNQLVEVAQMESMARLAAGVAHEVKNPLTVIILGVEYLRKHQPAGGSAVMQVLDDMTAAVRRADRVIQSMLEFSSPKLIRREPVQLNDIAEGALGAHAQDFAQHAIVVERHFAADLPWTGLDIGRMEQVFANVYRNAIDAMHDGGTLTVTTGVKRLGELARDDAAGSILGDQAFLALEIDDTGPGIPDELLPKVLDPFFTTKPAGHSTGLGLTVVKKIVDSHGGILRIRNREGRGVRVSIGLPMPVDA